LRSFLKRLRGVADALFEVCKYPLLIALFGFDATFVIPLCLFSASMYGYYAVGGMVLFQAPVIFLLVREVIRQMRALPQSEAWETNPERWQKVVEEYVDLVVKSRENDENDA